MKSVKYVQYVSSVKFKKCLKCLFFVAVENKKTKLNKQNNALHRTKC